MRTAKEWQEDWGIKVTDNVIKRIQADALSTAADICIRLHVTSDNTDCAKAILREADKIGL